MKMNFLIPIISAVLLGYLCASFVLAEYDNSLENNNVYFLQSGAYTSLESSKDDLTNIDNKLTIKENDKYYSYIGITASLNEAERIKKMYQDKKIDLYVKKVTIDNKEFINQLSQYEVLLKNSKTLDEINRILKVILATYEENIINT